MHTVIIPTDFSPVALNAIQYALGLFRNRPSRFILVHSLDDRQPTGALGSGLRRHLQEQLEKDMAATHAAIEKMEWRHAQTITEEVRQGEAVSTLVSVAKDFKADCIVLGTTGASGLKETLIGSVAAGCMKKAPCPVIAVPGEARFKPLAKVVLSTDFKPIKNLAIYDYMKSLLDGSKAELTVLNVGDEPEKVSMVQTMAGVNMHDYLKDIPHHYEFIEGHVPHEAILDYTEENQVDMLVMLRHDDDFLRKLFRRSSVEKVAMHTTIPLLSLNE